MKTKQKSGFTLIELLVVISIIAILMAIMMPALAKVREQAKALVCRTRMKSCMQAVLLYETDHGKLPMNRFIHREDEQLAGMPAGNYTWYNLTAPYVNKKKLTSTSSVSDERESAAGFEIYRCTTQDYITRLKQEWDHSSPIISPITGNPITAITSRGVYGYNPYFNQYSAREIASRPVLAEYNYKSSQQIRQPAELAMISDLRSEDAVYGGTEVSGWRMGVSWPNPLAYEYGWKPNNPRSPSNYDLYGPSPNHKNSSINYAFADGHIEAKRNLWPWNDGDNNKSRRAFFHPRREDLYE